MKNTNFKKCKNSLFNYAAMGQSGTPVALRAIFLRDFPVQIWVAAFLFF